MARKEKDITITDSDGSVLHFRIKQMPATKLERWIIRAVALVLGASDLGGIDMSKAEGLFKEKGLGALADVDIEKAFPLYDEMLACCSYVVGSSSTPCTNDLMDDLTSDVTVLFTLRKEAAALNLDFILQGVERPSDSQGKAASEPQDSKTPGQNMQMSPGL